MTNLKESTQRWFRQHTKNTPVKSDTHQQHSEALNH